MRTQNEPVSTSRQSLPRLRSAVHSLRTAVAKAPFFPHHRSSTHALESSFEASAIAATPAAGLPDWMTRLHVQGPVKFFLSPSSTAHQPFIDLIGQAQSAVKMTMYHLTDPAMVAALTQASARLPKGSTQIIEDGKSLQESGGKNNYAANATTLTAAGVNVISSSPKFSLTHCKAMLIDPGARTQAAIISSMNATRKEATTRDVGIVTTDPDIIREMNAVFDADVQNAKNGTAITPPLTNPNLVWSPVDSESKLSDLCGCAVGPQSTLTVTSECLTDAKVLAATIQAANSGAQVHVLVPEYIEDSPQPLLNYPALTQLKAVPNVTAHVMPYPSSAAVPYMHAKAILVQCPSGTFAYLGSENLTPNSLNYARELGFVCSDKTAPDVIAGLVSVIKSDWNLSIDPPANPQPPQPNFFPPHK